VRIAVGEHRVETRAVHFQSTQFPRHTRDLSTLKKCLNGVLRKTKDTSDVFPGVTLAKQRYDLI
jgi:hypothetical protein